jgi:polysaccharide export outer membrane protein
MRKIAKNGIFTGILAISSLFVFGCSAQNAMHPYAKTNHLRAQNAKSVNYNQPNSASRYGLRNASGSQRGSQGRLATPGPADIFQRWVDYEPAYTFYPGDQIDIVVQSAPELSRTLTVGPDGRVTMPMANSLMAAGRSIPQVRAALTAELAKQLRDPTVALTTRAFAPQQIFVGGQVGQQGTYTLPGPIGSLEAIIMAGGFLPSAKTKNVAILRRAPNGGLMMRTIDHKSGLRNVRTYADNMQLRRGDIIFVPRSNISEIGLFMQQYFRDAVPVDFGLSYNIGNNFSGN